MPGRLQTANRMNLFMRQVIQPDLKLSMNRRLATLKTMLAMSPAKTKTENNARRNNHS